MARNDSSNRTAPTDAKPDVAKPVETSGTEPTPVDAPVVDEPKRPSLSDRAAERAAKRAHAMRVLDHPAANPKESR